MRRNPEYMRAGKRKNADGSVRLVKETSKVSLILPDGKEFQGKKREIDRKIEEIIGLDVGTVHTDRNDRPGGFSETSPRRIKRAQEDIFQRSSRHRYTGECRRS